MGIPYRDKIYDIAINTFEITCYMFPLEEWEMEGIDEQSELDNDIRAIVRFNGAAEGGMVVNPSERLREAIASNMLGIDAPDEEEKNGALCEIANIICGNTVPLFAHDESICYIYPPRIVESGENTGHTFEGMNKESLRMFLDEGVADIFVYYKMREDI